jgi:hypothetical protein
MLNHGGHKQSLNNYHHENGKREGGKKYCDTNGRGSLYRPLRW